MEEKLNILREELEKIGKLNSSLALISWDMQTKMPKKAIEQRSAIIEYLAGEMFLLKTSDKMGKITEELLNNKDSMDDVQRAIVKLARKEYDETKKIPEQRYREFIIAAAISGNAWHEAKVNKDFEIFKPHLKKMIDYDETKKIPEQRYREFIIAAAISGNAWHEAKVNKDFEIFKPHLKKMIDFKREFVEYLGYDNNKYDTLLNQFEEGLTVEKLDKIFEEMKIGILELLEKIKKSNKKVNKDFLLGYFDKEPQERFSNFVLKKLGYDFEAGRMDESEHPFTTSFGNKDVRITTNYNNPELTYALFSAIHEGGHGIYEQDIPEEFVWTGLDSSLAMSIHESQSRFYENLIGRSKEFWEYFLDYAKYEFKELKDVSLEEFYEAINVVEPSLIRTEADELTYNLHIIIRYEIEKDLINGVLDIDDVREAWNSKYKDYLGIRTEADELTYNLHIIIRYEIEKDLINGVLDIDDVREAWNSKYKDYLGICPSNDSEGILQDIHWSDGSFGYFPSYSLGNLYGAQMLNKMKKDYKDMYLDIKNGEFSKVHNWLNDNVHKYGAVYSPSELIKKITGEELNPKYFLDYINKKYKKIYLQ